MLAEVNLRGGFDAGGPVPVIDAVQVHLQDLVFAVARLERGSDHRLAQLDEDRSFRRLDHRDLGELLGDGAGALLGPPGNRVDDAGLDHARPVDAAVVVEVFVLDGDRRVFQQRADVRQFDRLDGDALRVALLDQIMVAILDPDGAGGKVELARIGEGGGCIGDRPQDQEEEDGGRDADQSEPLPAILRPPGAGLPPGRLCRRGALPRLQGSGFRGPYAWAPLSQCPSGS